MGDPVFAPGSTITVREVLHGQRWLQLPEVVVADGDVLATVVGVRPP